MIALTRHDDMMRKTPRSGGCTASLGPAVTARFKGASSSAAGTTMASLPPGELGRAAHDGGHGSKSLQQNSKLATFGHQVRESANAALDRLPQQMQWLRRFCSKIDVLISSPSKSRSQT